MVATLLRRKVRLELVCRRRLEHAEARAFRTVAVVVERAVAVELHMVVVRRKLEHHRIVRELRQALDFVVIHRDVDDAARLHRIRHDALRGRARREIVREAHGKRLALLGIIFRRAIRAEPLVLRPVLARLLDLGLCTMAVEACELPLGEQEVAAVSVVIVNRRAPEARHRRQLHEFDAIVFIGSQIASRAREQDFKAFARNTEVDVGFHDMK